MDIPSLAVPSPDASNAMAIQDKKLELAEQATKQRSQNSGPLWGGPSWPMAGSQAARSMALGSSPLGRFMEPFGRSVDMADAGSHFPGSGLDFRPPLQSDMTEEVDWLVFDLHILLVIRVPN